MEGLAIPRSSRAAVARLLFMMLAVFTGNARAGVVLGTEVLEPAQGQSQTITQTISTAGFAGPFLLHAKALKLRAPYDGYGAAWQVWIDGRQVLGPSNLPRAGKDTTVQVNLQSRSLLEVRFAGEARVELSIDGTFIEVGIPPGGMVVEPRVSVLRAGQSAIFRALDAYGNPVAGATLSSSDASIATISNGVATASGANGFATVIARAGGRIATAVIAVPYAHASELQGPFAGYFYVPSVGYGTCVSQSGATITYFSPNGLVVGAPYVLVPFNKRVAIIDADGIARSRVEYDQDLGGGFVLHHVEIESVALAGDTIVIDNTTDTYNRATGELVSSDSLSPLAMQRARFSGGAWIGEMASTHEARHSIVREDCGDPSSTTSVTIPQAHIFHGVDAQGMPLVAQVVPSDGNYAWGLEGFPEMIVVATSPQWISARGIIDGNVAHGRFDDWTATYVPLP
jgi:hypothetical protein